MFYRASRYDVGPCSHPHICHSRRRVNRWSDRWSDHTWIFSHLSRVPSERGQFNEHQLVIRSELSEKSLDALTHSVHELFCRSANRKDLGQESLMYSELGISKTPRMEAVYCVPVCPGPLLYPQICHHVDNPRMDCCNLGNCWFTVMVDNDGEHILQKRVSHGKCIPRNVIHAMVQHLKMIMVNVLYPYPQGGPRHAQKCERFCFG